MNPAAVADILRRGEVLLGALGDDQYTRKLPAAYHASIGGHYRHCLDHFTAFFDGMASGAIDYDVRARDPRLENDRTFALALTRDLRGKAEAMTAGDLSRPVTARCKVGYEEAGETEATSTLGREAMFCISHAVHHHALIGVMCSLMDVPLPDEFGVAPSTLRHRESARGA